MTTSTAPNMPLRSSRGTDPGLMHRVAVIGAGTLDMLPHNGAVVTVLAVCGATHRESYFDIVMVGIVSSLVALAVVILEELSCRYAQAIGSEDVQRVLRGEISVATLVKELSHKLAHSESCRMTGGRSS